MDTFSPQPNIIPTVQAEQDFIAYNYVSFAALALIVYDTILIVPHGIEYIKGRRSNIVVILYICGQFGALGSLASIAFQNAALPHFISPGACNGLRLVQDLCSGFGAIGVQGLLLGRAYAIAPHNKKVMVLLGFAYVVIVGSAFGLFRWWKCSTVQGSWTSLMYVNFLRFTVILTQLVLSGEGVVIGVSLIFFDLGILVVTLYHAWAFRGLSRRTFSLRSEGSPGSLINLFIRQGVFRFLLLAAWSTADACVYKFARPSIAGVDQPLGMALSPIILGRFIFQLRSRYCAEPEESSNRVELSTFRAAVRDIETGIRIELGDNDIKGSDNSRYLGDTGNSTSGPSFQRDFENLGTYYASSETGDDNDIWQRPEEPERSIIITHFDQI